MHHDVVMVSLGRVTLPKVPRTALGLLPGMRVVFLRLPGGTMHVQVRRTGVDLSTVHL